MKLINIIIPAFNEEKNIVSTFEQIKLIKRKISNNYNLDILFADNCSSDDSMNILKSIAKNNSWVKVICYSRNYGYQRSIFEAIKHTASDAIVIIDCDLQDPPNLIIEFIKYWEKGYANVYGIRKKRKEKWIFFRNLFYKIINKISDFEIPINAGDFRLIDKIIVDKLKKMNLANPYLRGIIASIGFSSIGIEYTRNEREKGKSSAGFITLLKLSIQSITQFSSFPLRLLTLFGMTLTFFLALIILLLVFFRIYYGAGTENFLQRGFTLTWILILGSVGVNAIFLGIIGEYIANIHNEILNINKVFLKEKINFVEKIPKY